VEAARVLPPRLAFVGGHPFAGAAQGGLHFAQDGLFGGRPWFLTPVADADDAVDKLAAFVRGLGATATVIDAAAHDRLLAFVSHLPQLTASALMEVVGAAAGEDGLALAGRGLADTTRLASSPPEIWRDIASTNADEIGPALDRLIECLQQLRSDLGSGDALRRTFTEAARWRQALIVSDEEV
jgi:prephenate dehydrogenase